MKTDTTLSQIEAIAERVAAPAGLEIVEVQLKGSGRNHLLRIYIDKPEGVTHADCELVSREVGAILDEEDPIPGAYELEVSSPGLERKLGKWPDWQRFTGKKVLVVLKEPVEAGPAAAAPVPAAPARPKKASARNKQTEEARRADQNNEGLKTFDGVITGAEDHSVTVQLADGALVTFPFEQVSRAHLKFEW